MHPSGPATFADRVARLHAELARDGMGLADMRRAQTLELHYAGVPDLGTRSPQRPVGIEPLEGPIESRSVPRLAPSESRLRYFLDGAQRTFLVWRCGVVPVAATVAAAAVLERDGDGRCRIVPGTLRLEHAFLIPRRLQEPRLGELLRRIDDLGMSVIDPLDRHVVAGDDAGADDADECTDVEYGRIIELAYVAARDLRDGLELGLLGAWAAAPGRSADDGWIVVDGRLRANASRAIGLVKQFTDAYLTGADAATLLTLPPGHRTTAFFPTDRRRGGPDPEARTLWYLRLWDATGLDARHALIRVEAGADLRATADIDHVSGWLMAERTPRATADARWATLLYPVHYLERILKRRLEADTRGWPGG